jgi:anaerobic C4-dicarboxylate transporter
MNNKCHRKIARTKKEVEMKKIISVLLVIALLATMVSCIAVGSGGKKVDNQPTLGQQLIDLKKARDEGAVSAQEYAELREKLKKAYD